MALERIKWAIIIVLFLIDVVVFYVGYRIGERNAQLAFDTDVQVECSDAEVLRRKAISINTE